jgi:hypothetical protein
MLGTIRQYLDDARESLKLAQVTLEHLLPETIRKEATLARLAVSNNVWGALSSKYLGQGLKTEDGLRVSELLDAMEDIILCLGRAEVAKTLLEAATREPDLSLGKARHQHGS